jgi:ATP-dependent protease Clp ATPase subunit
LFRRFSGSFLPYLKAASDALGIEDLAWLLQTPKNSLIQQFRTLVRFHGADLMFTDTAIKEIAKIAIERGMGARGLRSVVEEVVERAYVRRCAGDQERDYREGAQ